MNRFNKTPGAAKLCIAILFCMAFPGVISKGQSENVLLPYDGPSAFEGDFPSVQTVDTTTITGKVVSGYQGWFNCEGDGADLGWTHWARNRREPFAPGNITVDLWPDVSEYDEDELFETGFVHEGGEVAKTFSSHNRKTVIRHFKWMRDYGIDGAFIQRFSNGLANPDLKRHKDVVLRNAREGANRHGRAYIVMYDLSGTPEDVLVDRVYEDWLALRSEMQITEDPAYLHHDGKPVVAIWGIGFNDPDGERPSIETSEALIDAFKSNGVTLMLGIPTGWRSQTRDALSFEEAPRLLEVLSKADILSPWTAGRYNSIPGAIQHGLDYWAPDVQWCAENDLNYLPVIHPGFSWYNLHGGELGATPRLEGRYMWTQAIEAFKAGGESIYVGMFDEVDEGTAIFKCTNFPPTGNGGTFLTYDGLPSDYYLRLAGKVGQLLRGEIDTDFDLDAFVWSLAKEDLETGGKLPSLVFTDSIPKTLDEGYDDLDVAVEALDVDGNISSVQLYLDGQLIGEKSSPPYQWLTHLNLDLLALPAGEHEITVIATDNDGLSREFTRILEVVVPGGADIGFTSSVASRLDGVSDIVLDFNIDESGAIAVDASTTDAGASPTEIEVIDGWDGAAGSTDYSSLWNSSFSLSISAEAESITDTSVSDRTIHIDGSFAGGVLGISGQNSSRVDGVETSVVERLVFRLNADSDLILELNSLFFGNAHPEGSIRVSSSGNSVLYSSLGGDGERTAGGLGLTMTDGQSIAISAEPGVDNGSGLSAVSFNLRAPQSDDPTPIRIISTKMISERVLHLVVNTQNGRLYIVQAAEKLVIETDPRWQNIDVSNSPSVDVPISADAETLFLRIKKH